MLLSKFQQFFDGFKYCVSHFNCSFIFSGFFKRVMIISYGFIYISIICFTIFKPDFSESPFFYAQDSVFESNHGFSNGIMMFFQYSNYCSRRIIGTNFLEFPANRGKSGSELSSSIPVFLFSNLIPNKPSLKSKTNYSADKQCKQIWNKRYRKNCLYFQRRN